MRKLAAVRRSAANRAAIGRPLGPDLAVSHRSLDVLSRFVSMAGAYRKRIPCQRRIKNASKAMREC